MSTEIVFYIIREKYRIDHIAGMRKTVMARAMINKAFDNDIVSGNTIKVFKRVKKLLKGDSNARDRVLSTEEFDKLLTALPSHTRAIVVTGYYAGLRKEEVINLTWDKVDMKSRIIALEVTDTKDREARRVPICDALYSILKDIPRAIHDNHVFLMNCPAASCGVSKTSRNEASFGEYDPERFKGKPTNKGFQNRIKEGLSCCRDTIRKGNERGVRT
jgi:integrase